MPPPWRIQSSMFCRRTSFLAGACFCAEAPFCGEASCPVIAMPKAMSMARAATIDCLEREFEWFMVKYSDPNCVTAIRNVNQDEGQPSRLSPVRAGFIAPVLKLRTLARGTIATLVWPESHFQYQQCSCYWFGWYR